MSHTIRVDNGKYTFINHGGTYEILRYDERWHGPQGLCANAIASLMAELDAARVVIDAVRKLSSIPVDIESNVHDVFRALDQHDRLVADCEPPSDWTK